MEFARNNTGELCAVAKHAVAFGFGAESQS
jgi:hypothetical protein